MREVRFEEDEQAHVPVRHGSVVIGTVFFRRLGVWKLLVIELFEL